MRDVSDKILKDLLVQKTKLTRQAIEKRRNKIKQQYGPMVNVEAYAVLCQLNSIDTSKLIDIDTMKRVREICQLIAINIAKGKNSTEDITTENDENFQKTTSKISNVKLKDPILDKKILDDAVAMAKIYASIYIFENSIRKVISIIMTKNYGENWWGSMVTPKAIMMKKGAEIRMQDDNKNAWHGKRGNHPVYYTDMSDLYDFIDEYWKVFKIIFPKKTWINVRLEEINRSRNTIDHHNLLNQSDYDRLKIYLEDWYRQLSSVKHLLE